MLLLLILLVSCRKKEEQPVTIALPRDSSAATTTDTVIHVGVRSFLALGDSYTIGQSVDSSERFPAQTAALLSQQNIAISPIRYIATSGWTTINLQNAIDQQNPIGTYDIVTLLIGVNDQYQSNDTTNYRSRFTGLLNKAISLAGRSNHVFVLSIPDWGVTPFGKGRSGVGKQIDLFNQINKEVTTRYGISYTDVTKISRDDAGDNTMLANDGLHPSGKQYAQWSKLLAPKIYEVFK